MSRGKPFAPGNKFGRGRPRGSRNTKSLIAQELLESHAEPVLRKALGLALEGDTQIISKLLPYLLPRPKEPPVKIGPLPSATTEEIAQSYDAILKKVSTGQLTVSQAQELLALFEERRHLLETLGFDARLGALEELLKPWAVNAEKSQK
jgi:hypothetical protein